MTDEQMTAWHRKRRQLSADVTRQMQNVGAAEYLLRNAQRLFDAHEATMPDGAFYPNNQPDNGPHTRLMGKAKARAWRRICAPITVNGKIVSPGLERTDQ